MGRVTKSTPTAPAAAGERIAELAAEVRRLNDLYYGRGDSPLGKVNAPAELTGPTIRHARPMLSLAKATGEEQVRVFCARFAGQAFRVSEKLDGLSLSVVYRDGGLEHVATRGTGEVGELVTDKARRVLPDLPGEVDTRGRVEVRGEAVMLRSVWAAYNEAHPDRTLTNPRSGAAGTFMHKDPEAAAQAGRLLRFFAFGAEREGVLRLHDPAAFDAVALATGSGDRSRTDPSSGSARCAEATSKPSAPTRPTDRSWGLEWSTWAPRRRCWPTTPASSSPPRTSTATRRSS